MIYPLRFIIIVSLKHIIASKLRSRKLYKIFCSIVRIETVFLDDVYEYSSGNQHVCNVIFRKFFYAQCMNAYVQALVEDKVEFIKLFLEHGLDIAKYLTTDQLAKIYSHACENYPPLVKLLKRARNGNNLKSYYMYKDQWFDRYQSLTLSLFENIAVLLNILCDLKIMTFS